MTSRIENRIQAEVKDRQSAPQSDERLEKPRIIGKDTVSDSHSIFGQDRHGNSLLVKITRRSHRLADVRLILHLQDGRTFTLPDHPDIQAVCENDGSFSAAGLSMQCLIPFISWRLRFNGLLRPRIRSEWTANCQDEELVSVKFNFIWAAKTKPLHWPYDWDVKLMASSVAGQGEDLVDQLSKLNCQGYDQFGAMLGEIFINGEEKERFEVNLPGIRQRRWTLKSNRDEVLRYSSVIGVCDDGIVFHIVGKKEFKVEFQTGDRSKNIPLLDKLWKTDYVRSEMTVNGEKGNAIGLFSTTTKDDKNTIPVIPLYKSVQYCEAKPKKDKFIYQFADAEASSVLICGGKGASLALLTSIANMTEIIDRSTEGQKDIKAPSQLPKFTVPNGFVLSVSAMDVIVDQIPAIDSSIEKLVAICAEGGDFQDQCEVVKLKIEAVQLTDEIVKAVKEALLQISDKEGVRIAVRSSSVCEDGEDVSAAGQNETFLGLRSVEDILMAIKRCWASLYSHQSVHYRKQNIQPIRTGMAVVLQTMLAAESAGVLFSQHPITGDRKQCLISANYGLGESVVSGEVDPDNFVVQRSHYDDQLKIVERVCGKKGYKIQMTEDNDVEKVQFEGEEFCLRDDVVLKLAEIGIVLEKLYGNGRDIEWGLKENKIYLLQSRPITSLNQFSDWELTHEFDTPFMSEEDLSTTSTVQEVMPGALCPLTRHYILKGLEASILQALQGTTDVLDQYNRFLTTSRHHVFMDVFKSFFMDVSDTIQIHQRMNSITMCGYDFITEDIHKIALKRAPDASEAPSKIRLLYGVFKDCWNIKSTAEATVALAKAFKTQYSPEGLTKFTTARDLHLDIGKSLSVLIEVCVKHCSASTVHAFCNRIIMMMLTNGQMELNEDNHTDYRLISSSAKDTESADVPKKLEIMAKGIFLTGKKEEFCKIEPDSGAEWLKENAPEMSKVFEEFIRQNSHRGFQEYDFASTTWGMRPGIIIEMLQSLLKFAENVESLGKTNEVTDMSPEELMRILKSPSAFWTKWILKKAIGWSHSAVQYREQTKSSFINVIHQFRLAFRQLGVLMAKEGYLPHPDLVLYFTGDELTQLFDTRDVHLIKKATRRQKLIPQLKKDRYDYIISGAPTPNNINKTLKFESGTEIRGTPVFGGLVTGRACVIHEFKEVSKIQPGDILITYSTDIGWSPYFPILGGIVTEIGGLISHGAVVAREYGLPCIVAATGATDFFTFGETVTLDSEKGIIFKGTGN